MTKTHLIALAAAFGLSTVALADDARSFQSLDANNDGYVARDEIPADHPLAANFSAYDTDADGRSIRTRAPSSTTRSDPVVRPRADRPPRSGPTLLRAPSARFFCFFNRGIPIGRYGAG
jgi:hypothetical protein